jgi:hypothetical protein
MKDLLRATNQFAAAGLFFAGTCLSLPTNASAAFLYWGSPKVHTASLNACFGFANNAMQDSGFKNIRRTSVEVTGVSGNSYAAVTCLQTSPQATAIVMAVGEDGNEVAHVRDTLSAKIAAIVCFDTPCF